MASLVTIIIPTYNYGSSIKETLLSIEEQEYLNLEIIIVDDGSTDNTRQVVQEFVDRNAPIIYLHQQNKGVSAARNAGVNLARGEYIQFLDADDSISTKKIALQVREMDQNRNLDITYTRAFYYREQQPEKLYLDFALKNIPWLKEATGYGQDMLEEMLLVNFSTIHSPLIRKSFVDKFSLRFDETMSHLEDWDFWFKCAANNAYIKFFDDNDAFALVRVHSASASQDNYKLDLGAVVLRNNIDKYLRDSIALQNDKKQALRRLNQQFQKQPVKYLILNGLHDVRRLRLIYMIAGSAIFAQCFPKAVAMKIKRFFKHSGSNESRKSY